MMIDTEPRECCTNCAEWLPAGTHILCDACCLVPEKAFDARRAEHRFMAARNHEHDMWLIRQERVVEDGGHLVTPDIRECNTAREYHAAMSVHYEAPPIPRIKEPE
jgi:hypothetical protein